LTKARITALFWLSNLTGIAEKLENLPTTLPKSDTLQQTQVLQIKGRNTDALFSSESFFQILHEPIFPQKTTSTFVTVKYIHLIQGK